MNGVSRLWMMGGLLGAWIVGHPLLVTGNMIDEWERFDTASHDKRADEEPVPGKHWTDSLTGIRFVWITGGCYTMGSPPWKEHRENDEGPVHQVCVSDFWLADRETTQGQWQSIMRINPSHFQKGETFPLEHVSWIDAEVISANLNERFQGRAHFRLPTEAEWEYSCREGGDSIDYAGRSDVTQLAWFADNSKQATQPAATRQPNRLGLYDMSGNVREWTLDTYHPGGYHKHKEENPKVIEDDAFKTVRGGSWKDGATRLRCTSRSFARTNAKQSDLGFRLAAVAGGAPEIKRSPTTGFPF
ncbi:MAG: SUMF1/EgtB/PvdO family nonheme iron enzyme [Magnetococcales bacterium]|nr:SUMF1/EgtB/PvdO family nonheme iron enzyme [Magnetococcales bacterium]